MELSGGRCHFVAIAVDIQETAEDRTVCSKLSIAPAASDTLFFMIALLACPFFFYPPFAERIGEVFILLHVFLFVFFSSGNDFSATRGPIHAKFCMRAYGVAWVGTCLLSFWGSATPAGGGQKEGNEIRVVSFLNRTATISVYFSVTKCGQICKAHTCTHSGVEP